MIFNLREKIVASLGSSDSELWFPHLTYDLVETGWRKLREDVELDPTDYGTARVILKDPDAEREILYTLFIKNAENEVKDMILVEGLPEIIVDYHKKSGVDFYTFNDFLVQKFFRNEILDCLIDAFNIIRRVPSLYQTVVCLVRSIHLIKPESDEYDVSFSEPHIPFSIFVSVPQKNSPTNALRVAEAIVHEAMHLQLTLIENIIPLTNTEELYYSPWKEEYRTLQGVLQALYVFRVIGGFFERILLHKLPIVYYDFIIERRQQINNQIGSIQNFENSSGLTILGRHFVNKLSTL